MKIAFSTTRCSGKQRCSQKFAQVPWRQLRLSNGEIVIAFIWPGKQELSEHRCHLMRSVNSWTPRLAFRLRISLRRINQSSWARIDWQQWEVSTIAIHLLSWIRSRIQEDRENSRPSYPSAAICKSEASNRKSRQRRKLNPNLSLSMSRLARMHQNSTTLPMSSEMILAWSRLITMASPSLSIRTQSNLTRHNRTKKRIKKTLYQQKKYSLLNRNLLRLFPKNPSLSKFAWPVVWPVTMHRPAWKMKIMSWKTYLWQIRLRSLPQIKKRLALSRMTYPRSSKKLSSAYQTVLHPLCDPNLTHSAKLTSSRKTMARAAVIKKTI